MRGRTPVHYLKDNDYLDALAELFNEDRDISKILSSQSSSNQPPQGQGNEASLVEASKWKNEADKLRKHVYDLLESVVNEATSTSYDGGDKSQQAV